MLRGQHKTIRTCLAVTTEENRSLEVGIDNHHSREEQPEARRFASVTYTRNITEPGQEDGPSI